MNPTNSSVDGYIRKNKRWQAELEKLRTILIESGLTEEVKWRSPCYTFEGTNVVVTGAFKEYAAMTFFKGALLKDAEGFLEMPGENTQSARVIRFTSVQQIVEKERILRAYIREAIEVERSGLKVTFKKITEHKIPRELQEKFNEAPAFQNAFRALTPGRQRAYLLLFSGAKQSTTRAARIEKHRQRILKGKGIED